MSGIAKFTPTIILNREVDPEEMLGAEIKFPDVDIALALSRCGKLFPFFGYASLQLERKHRAPKPPRQRP